MAHTVDFTALSSYRGSRRGGEVRILTDLREPIAGKHLLLVEDIIDRGRTLDYLHRVLQARHPASLRTCVLVRKQRAGPAAAVDYLGFELPDVWVVGYGLDHDDHYRTLPHIAELRHPVDAMPAPSGLAPRMHGARPSPFRRPARANAGH